MYHDALLIVYPTDHPLSTKVLQVPQTLAKDTPLQVALVPWELTSGAFHSADWKAKESTVERSLDSQLAPVLDAAGKEVITQRRFYQAIHILGISREVFDYVSQIPRTYCFWTGPADAGNIGPGYETLLLKDFLSACKWTDLGLYSNARLVLVHVGGLASLHLLPGLAERRLQVGLRFMTYGTHPSVPHAQWGVREIYPLGQFPRRLLAFVVPDTFDAFRRRNRYVYAECDNRKPRPSLQPYQEDRRPPDMGVLCVAVGRGHGCEAHMSRTEPLTCL